MNTKTLISAGILALAATAPFTQAFEPQQASESKPHMLGSQARYATEQIEGVEIFDREAGTPGQPQLVLLHGFPTSSHMFRNLIDKVGQNLCRVLIINSDTALDGNLEPITRRLDHGRRAIGHQSRRAHQAGTEGTVLHAIGRAATVQVDFNKPEFPRNRHSACKIFGNRAPQLQCQGVLDSGMLQPSLGIPVQQRIRRKHFRIQQRVLRELSMKDPAMTVRPLHHRGDGEAGVSLNVPVRKHSA